MAGLGDGVFSWNDFLRGNVRVVEGTTVIWTVGSDEAHTVTFLAGMPRPDWIVPQEEPDRAPMIHEDVAFPRVPRGIWDGTSFIHSGELGLGQEFAVTFGRRGRFDYVCMLHPAMAGIVEVVAPGSEGLTTQADVERSVTGDAGRLAAQIADLDRLRDTKISLPGPGGTTLWFVRAGTDRRGGRLDIMAFLPEDLEIRSGDTVVWHVDHAQVHTITFPPVGGDEPEFLQVQLADGTILEAPEPGEPMSPEIARALADPAAAPRLVLGPGAASSRAGPAHDGGRLFNSGLIGEHPGVALPLPKTWALTFSTPGEFEYLCVLHDPLGMEGKITVLPR
jgi:plastocyanin